MHDSCKSGDLIVDKAEISLIGKVKDNTSVVDDSYHPNVAKPKLPHLPVGLDFFLASRYIKEGDGWATDVFAAPASWHDNLVRKVVITLDRRHDFWALNCACRRDSWVNHYSATYTVDIGRNPSIIGSGKCLFNKSCAVTMGPRIHRERERVAWAKSDIIDNNVRALKANKRLLGRVSLLLGGGGLDRSSGGLLFDGTVNLLHFCDLITYGDIGLGKSEKGDCKNNYRNPISNEFPIILALLFVAIGSTLVFYGVNKSREIAGRSVACILLGYLCWLVAALML